MNNILVPTDFSDCAGYALEFATCLAEIYDAKIFVYHNIDDNKSIFKNKRAEKEVFHEEQELESYLKKKFNTISQDFTIILPKVKTFYGKGNLVDNIKEYVDTYEIDFIVMGSHGISGKNEYFIGSNTQKVVRSVHCPVFVVKNSVKDYFIDQVIFASNFLPEDVKSLKYLLEFLKPFDPIIHLVEINTPGWFNQPYSLEKAVMDDFKNMCKGFKCETHFYKDYSVEAGIRHITEEIGADLIVLSNQNRKPLKRLLSGSNVEFIVNHASVPVLSIDLTKNDK